MAYNSEHAVACQYHCTWCLFNQIINH